MRRVLELRTLAWSLREPFTTARGVQTTADAILVTLTDEWGRRGRGESYGIPYEGETPQSMREQLEALRTTVESGATRAEIQPLMPPGGARCALDLALWDLEAKQTGVPVWQRAGLSALRPVVSAWTIGLRSLAATIERARELCDQPVLKIKVDDRDPVRTIEAVHAAAPGSRLIVDPNQSWSFAQLRALAPSLPALGVVLLEQPLAVGADAGLAKYRSPVPVCADELVHGSEDLPRALGRYDAVNIKLDKAGGLTEGLALAGAARAAGLRLMVGCMAGSSLAMAPAFLLAQLCDFVDLDGPLLQREDWPHAIRYERGRMSVPEPSLWG